MITVDLISPRGVEVSLPSDLVMPGRMVFFVFKIYVGYDFWSYLPGLEVAEIENGYLVGGTVDRFSAACYELLNVKSPHDTCNFYRRVYTEITRRGFTMRGERTSQAKKFYLK